MKRQAEEDIGSEALKKMRADNVELNQQQQLYQQFDLKKGQDPY